VFKHDTFYHELPFNKSRRWAHIFYTG